MLIPAFQNIDILQHKKAKLPKHLQHSVHFLEQSYFRTLECQKFDTTKIWHGKNISSNFSYRTVVIVIRWIFQQTGV